jgi:DNA-binding Lrp family transcriptional regulator
MGMEKLNREILEILEGNSRLNFEQMAAMLGTDTADIETRVKDLEEKGIVVKYHTLINWEKAGEEGVSAIIEVKVTPQRGFGFDAIAERLYRFPEVKTLYLMSGSYDISVLIEGKTMKEVAFFVATKLATIEEVQSTATHFVLKKYKQEGVIFEDKEKDRRLVISP